MIPRQRALDKLETSFRVHQSIALVGPRQCGKSTLARMYVEQAGETAFFDLERSVDRRKLETPELALGGRRGLVVLDEAQRMPALFETLRVLLDRPGNDARFLILGSASPTLLRDVPETLAGRVGYVDLSGFSLDETGPGTLHRLWMRGGFPRSFLAANEAASFNWRENFARTFLERDIPGFGIRVPSETLRRFWMMLAHYHGQIWNAAEFARALGANEMTARRYLDILAGAFMVRVLPPWFENLKKRQVKSPKVYIRDPGLLHMLLGIENEDMLTGHPKVGASWEGFVIEQLLDGFGERTASYWATHAGAEVDLLLTIRGKRYGFECKYSDAPGTTRSMRVALDDLSLEHLWIVYPGRDRYDLDTRITALPAREIPDFVGERLKLQS